MTDYDSPWKDALEHAFPEFMAFFFPEAHADIDWSRGYESLDTELQQIVRDAPLGTRLADSQHDAETQHGEQGDTHEKPPRDHCPSTTSPARAANPASMLHSHPERHVAHRSSHGLVPREHKSDGADHFSHTHLPLV